MKNRDRWTLESQKLNQTFFVWAKLTLNSWMYMKDVWSENLVALISQLTVTLTNLFFFNGAFKITYGYNLDELTKSIVSLYKYSETQSFVPTQYSAKEPNGKIILYPLCRKKAFFLKKKLFKPLNMHCTLWRVPIVWGEIKNRWCFCR